MTNSPQPEQIWVSVLEAARITGYNTDYVRKLASESWHLPDADRPIRIRLRGRAYEIWLPDLLNYIKNRGLGPLTKPNLADLEPEEIWVTLSEGAKICNYSYAHIRKIVGIIVKRPENERAIKIRTRSFGYELWLPDLVGYLKHSRAGTLDDLNST